MKIKEKILWNLIYELTLFEKLLQRLNLIQLRNF